MKTVLHIAFVLLVTSLSTAKAQRTSKMKNDFTIGDVSDSVNIVVIKSNEIPTALNKALAPGNDQGMQYPTTIYTNPSNEVHVVHVNNKKGNNTYVFEKNSNVILMLKPGKAKTEKPATLATK